MTLGQYIAFGVEQANEKILEDLHEVEHSERLVLVEAARLLEEFASSFSDNETKSALVGEAAGA